MEANLEAGNLFRVDGIIAVVTGGGTGKLSLMISNAAGFVIRLLRAPGSTRIYIY